MGEIFTNHPFDKELIFKIWKKLKQLSRKEIAQLKMNKGSE
jgi:hypothetical protein